MNIKQIREMAPAEIEKKLRDNSAELLKLRLKKQTGQLEKPHLIKSLRQENARLQTILHATKA